MVLEIDYPCNLSPPATSSCLPHPYPPQTIASELLQEKNRKESKERKKERKRKKLGDESDSDRKSVSLEVVLMGRDFRAPEDDDLSQRVAGSVLWAGAV